MYSVRKGIVIFSGFVLFYIGFLATPVLANNPPDSGHSSLSASGQAQADGQSTISVSITLQDSSGNALSSDNVSFSSPNDSTIVFNPTSATLDSSGQTTFTVTSTNVGTDNISVTDTSSNTPLNNLGQVTFTTVLSPTPTPTVPGTCNDSAPGSTPQLSSANANGASQITLTWTDATDPVSYYLIGYGTSSGQYIYGNPNVGGQGTTSYTVNNLASGTTYYFAIKAVNGCTPGSYSNEVLGTTTGGVIASTPVPTQGAVSDTSSDTSNQTDTPTDTPSNTPAPSHIVSAASAKPQMSTKSLVIYSVGGILLIGCAGGFIFIKYRMKKKMTEKIMAEKLLKENDKTDEKPKEVSDDIFV